MINRTVRHHLEILSAMRRWRVRVLSEERIHHAEALDRALLDAVDFLRLLDFRRFENGRHNVYDMVELMPDPALVLDDFRPRDRHALARAAEMRHDLLGPGERRVERPCPAD